MIIYKDLNNLSSYFNGTRISIKRDQTKDIQSFKALEINLNGLSTQHWGSSKVEKKSIKKEDKN